MVSKTVGEVLGFPFQKLTDLDVSFGNVRNEEELLKAAREASDAGEDFFNRQNAWTQAAHYISEHTLTDDDQQAIVNALITSSKRIFGAQWKYLMAWLKSYSQAYEVKIAVGGYILSKMLKECPSLGQ